MYNNDDSYFEKQLKRAKNRVSSRFNEVFYVHKYLNTLVSHIKQIKNDNPNIDATEMKEKLFAEIDNYSTTVFENSLVFSEYMEYIASQYLQGNFDKYKEISEKLKVSDIDYDSLEYQDCHTFDEILSLYVYTLKKDLFKALLGKYIEHTPDNYKNFDELLNDNKTEISKAFFGKFYSLPDMSDLLKSDIQPAQKKAKIKEYSTWYRNPKDKVSFNKYANLFMAPCYSYAFLSSDEKSSKNMLKEDLAKSTSELVRQLDSLGHLKSYMNLYVLQMCDMGFYEYVTPLCKNGMPNEKFANSIKGFPMKIIENQISEIVDIDKVKLLLSENYLLSNSDLSVESLLALNSFWSNRYAKELDLYSEAMFAVHDFGIIDKVLANEPINITIDDLNEMLIKMSTLYLPAFHFLEGKQRETDSTSHEKAIKSGNVNDNIIRFSYEPFFEKLNSKFGEEYKKYFDTKLPNHENNLADDADWYIRLYNPIYASYSIKDESINALVSSINNPKTANFPNAGIMLYHITKDDTTANIPPYIMIGIDAGLSFPIRIHTKNDVLINFLKSINGHAILPLYEGVQDFDNPNSLKPLSANIIVPLDEKHKKIMKKAVKNADSYLYPNFVAHLGFTDAKHPPMHLTTQVTDTKGKIKNVFLQKYVDLETGTVYLKEDDKFIKYVPTTKEGGNLSHELE